MPAVLGKQVGAIGHGLMGYTWRPKQTPDEQAFEAMDRAVAHGANLFNSGEFYGTPEPTMNLQLLHRYFKDRPELRDKVVLSVKGGFDVNRSVNNILKILDGVKSLDIFECARVNPNVPIETTVGTLARLVKAGKIGGIGLSECGAQTIRRAHKVHPIAAVEVEYSLWTRDIETNGVYDTCRELGIPIVAYSPLGSGMLAGQFKSPSDLPEGDSRRYFDRFQPKNFEHNRLILESIEKLAEKHKCTPAQLSLAWVASHEGVIPIPGATTKARVEENCRAADVKLSEADLEEIAEVTGAIGVKGGRFSAGQGGILWG